MEFPEHNHMRILQRPNTGDQHHAKSSICTFVTSLFVVVVSNG
jgi:hypothetical protein